MSIHFGLNSTNGNIQAFELTDGLPAEIFNEGSVATFSSGIIAFGSVSGIATFNPKLITTNQETPKLAISSIEAIDYNGVRHPVDFRGNQFEVNHEIQTLNINFVGLTYNKTAKNQYQYTLNNYLKFPKTIIPTTSLEEMRLKEFYGENPEVKFRVIANGVDDLSLTTLIMPEASLSSFLFKYSSCFVKPFSIS